MRQHLAFAVLGLLAGGCSWIYNPDNLKDARVVDIETIADADLAHPDLTEVYPTTVYEGAGVTQSGTGVGVPALLVLRGHNFAKDPAEHLMVTMTPDTGGMLVVDDVEVARDGDFIAVTVTAPIDGACHDQGSHAVTITVQQDDGLGGTAMTAPLGGLTIACLDELTASPASASALKSSYSEVDITGNLAFPPNETPNAIALVHSMSYVNITGNVTADATAAGPGPGGNTGGTAGGTLYGSGGPGAGSGAGGAGTGGIAGSGGGGAGFASAGSIGAGANGGGAGAIVGDLRIPSYTTNYASGGGGGGGTALNASGVGGAGGGTVELTARGTITVGGMVSAVGAAGASGNASGGGGGSGGVIVLRAYQTLTVGSLSVAKGAGGGTGNTAGGDGSVGRTRIDAANASSLGIPTVDYRGPMFMNAPTSVTTQTPMIQLVAGLMFDTANGLVIDRDGGVMTFNISFGTTSPPMATVMPTLTSGYNQVCAVVTGGDPNDDVAKNCVEIAFLPGGS